jgi:ketosteroid isomerase-like protein
MNTYKIARRACIALAAIVLGTSAVARSATPAPAQNRTLRAEIEAVHDSMTAVFNRGNPAGVARFYGDDARVDGERTAPIRGRAAIDTYWRGIANAKSWKLEIIEVGGSRDQPYEIGRSTLTTSSPSGDRVSVVEYLVLWRRETNGALRIAVDYYRY